MSVDLIELGSLVVRFIQYSIITLFRVLGAFPVDSDFTRNFEVELNIVLPTCTALSFFRVLSTLSWSEAPEDLLSFTFCNVDSTFVLEFPQNAQPLFL